jgi:hypothetical protein
MTDEGRSTAAQMAVTLSVSLISAALLVAIAVLAYASSVIENLSQYPWFFAFLCLSLCAFIASSYSGWKGISRVRKEGYYGDWTPAIGRRYFNLQAALLGLGALLLFISVLTAPTIQFATMTHTLSELKKHTQLLDSLVHKPYLPTEPPDTGISGISAKFPVWMWSLSAGLVVLGGFLSLLDGFKNSNDVKILGRILLSFGGLSLFAESTLTLGGITFNVQLPIDLPRPAETFEFQQLPSVGFFREACDTLDNKAQIDSLARELSARLQSDSLATLIIVGRADKRRLNPQPALRYGSNENLARSRAAYVRQQLVQRLPALLLNHKKILTLTSGAEYVGVIVRPDSLAQDRCVEVWAYWKRTKR